MSEQVYAAVDLGGESGRVVAGRFDGEKLRLEEVHRFPNIPVQVANTLHWDTLRLWNDIQDGLAKLGKQLRSGAALAGIGVDTWGVDFGLLDARDELIGNPVHYRDARTVGMMEYAGTIVPQSEIYARTGLQFMPFNSLFQLIALKKGGSPQLDAARNLLFTPDLLHFWLTGVKANEYTIASTSQMLDARRRDWDTELLGQFGLPAGLLQTLVPPGTVLGKLRPELAARLNLGRETPVIAPGSHDTASAVAAVPWESAQGTAYVSSGTWSLMGLELPEPLISERTFQLGFTNEGGAGNTIRFLKNIAGLWLVQECRRSWQRNGEEYDYGLLTRLAAGAPDDGPFIEPDEARFGVPSDMPASIRGYCRETGQAQPKTVGEIVRCCLDSLALKYRWVLERLEELQGSRIESLHIVGGGTQNRFLSQLTADCLGRPVIAGPVEATAAGNILVQALARGELSGPADIRRVVRASFETETFLPSAETKALWDDRFGKFAALPR